MTRHRNDCLDWLWAVGTTESRYADRDALFLERVNPRLLQHPQRRVQAIIWMDFSSFFKKIKKLKTNDYFIVWINYKNSLKIIFL